MVATSIQARLAERDAEVASLRAELAQLRQQLAELREQLAAANAHSAKLVEQLAALTEQVAKGNDRNAELLAIAQRKKRGPDKPPPAEPAAPPELEEPVRTAFEDRPRPPDLRGALHDRPRPKQRPTGRKPLPAHLPVEEQTVYPERCACGCQDFEWVDEVVEEKLDVAAHQRIRRTRRKTGRCKSCLRRTTAPAPPSPFPRSKATPGWLAWLVCQRYRLLVPIDRLHRYLGAQGLPLSKSYLSEQLDRAAELVDPIDGEHWRDLLGGAWMGTDGTGFKVQVPGVGLHHGHFEVYHRDDIVVYQYTPEKGGEWQAERLTMFAGTLLVDGESRYNETTRDGRIKEANCNAHPRQRLRDAEVVQPVLAAEGGQFVSKMFELEAIAKERGLAGPDLLAWREAEIRPISERFLGWMNAVEPTLLRGDPVAKVIRYYRRHWTALFLFLTDANIPIDNSASERLFQVIAKLRLSSLFAGGTEGAHRAAVLLGVIATCNRLDVDPEAYLNWVFVRRGTHRAKYGLSASELTPAAYKRAITPSAA